MINSVFLFLDIGGGEMMLILIVVLIFFGSKKIPELARGLGKGMREFKDASNSIRNEITRETQSITQDVRKVAQEIKEHADLADIKKETQSVTVELGQMKNDIETSVADSGSLTETIASDVTTPPELSEGKNVTDMKDEVSSSEKSISKGPVARVDPDDLVKPEEPGLQ